MIRRTFLLLSLLALACNRTQPDQHAHAPSAKAPAATAPQNGRDIDEDNLLNIAYGACVVSRSGELNLENSAAQVIDGMPQTVWISPPGGPSETFVFSLAAPSRIERLGVTTVADADSVPARVRFEASADGRTWREVRVVELHPTSAPQLVDVEPFDARYIRVETIEPSRYYANIRSIHAVGREIAPPTPAGIGGCWTINGAPSTFEQHGARVTGVISGRNPMLIEGGSDGRVSQVMWREASMWGYAALTLSPDGRHLSGVRFHEEVDGANVGESFFGERCTSSAPSPDLSVNAEQIFARVRRWSLFGLAFDARDALLEEPSAPELDAVAALIRKLPASQRLRIVARELRTTAPADELRKRTLKRAEAVRLALQKRGIDASRLDVVGAGSDSGGTEITYAIQRLLTSRVDLEPLP